MNERRRGAARSEAAHRSILEATAALFAEKGYDHLTIEGIAARAHVGKQTIYRWWPSKAEVVAECLLEGVLLPDQFTPPTGGRIRDDMVVWLEALMAFVTGEEHAGLFRSLVAAAMDNAEIGRMLRAKLGDESVMVVRLQEAVDAGELAHGTPLRDVSEAFAGMLALRVLSRAPAEVDAAERMVDAVLGPYLSRA
ncbi:TetR/AcrR family transcriptional regulator [Agromyces mangrovi Wang et al. 2018]|uniref:TetR/AcrR family transcriptional regulator n=1 Tax=Agromyces mangrovi TaxID=1858653 RepID=UPI002573E09D|nr:TetR/AcrR family transcriptional regulator [Agromyces mangrovi]BDZ64678.1 TetR family transcriptional regulator [Agromyces mangrovi]